MVQASCQAIDYFSYGIAQPLNGGLGLTTALAGCPWKQARMWEEQRGKQRSQCGKLFSVCLEDDTILSLLDLVAKSGHRPGSSERGEGLFD